MLRKEIRNYLLSPMPDFSTKEKIHFAWLTSLFLFLFLLFFQPFGVNNYRTDEAITTELIIGLSVFATVTCSIILFNELIIYRLFKFISASIPVIIWIAWCVILMSSMIYLTYNYMGNWHDWSLNSYLGFLFNISILSIIPFTFVSVYFRIKTLRQTINQSYSYPIKEHLQERTVTFSSDNGKDTLVIKTCDLLFVQSEDNYVNIHYLDQGIPTKSLIRQTLKNIEASLNEEVIRKCHRSYLVNFFQVSQIEGNRNKMHLKLTGMKDQIPVARNYIDEILTFTSK